MIRRLIRRRRRGRAPRIHGGLRGRRGRTAVARVLCRWRPIPHGRDADRLLAAPGAPAHSYDRIYVLGDGLINVAEAKPGDRDYNGGRWMVLPVTWAAGPRRPS